MPSCQGSCGCKVRKERELRRMLQDGGGRPPSHAPAHDTGVGMPGLAVPHPILFDLLDSESVDLTIPEEELAKLEPNDYAYYPGCVDYYDMEMQFSVENYGETNHGIIHDSSLKLLKSVGIEPLVLERSFMKCCGHDQLWQGKSQVFQALRDYNTQIMKRLEVKTLILNCAEGYRTFIKDYELGDIEVVHISQVLVERGFKVPEDSKMKGRVTYQDPCRMCRQMDNPVYDEPRALIEAVPGADYVEMEHFRDDLHCCGIAGMMYCNPKTKGLTARRMDEATDVDADYLLVACPKCLTHFGCMKHERILDEQSPYTFEIMDITHFLAEALETEAEAAEAEPEPVKATPVKVAEDERWQERRKRWEARRGKTG